jgi:hypothetical protein
VEVFQDLRFGTLMAVLPDLNITPPRSGDPGDRVPVVSPYLQSAGINASHFTLPRWEVKTKPLTIIRATPIHIGGPAGPGPVTTDIASQPAQPLSVGRGTASQLPVSWQGRIFSTAQQPTIALVPLAGRPITRHVPILSSGVPRAPNLSPQP